MITPNFSGVLREIKETTAPKEMLSVTKEGGRTKVRINSSSLSLIQTCPRKAFYTLVEGWRPKAGSPPLVFGNAIHKAMEAFYMWSSREREIPPDFDAVAQACIGGAAPEHPAYAPILEFIKAAEPLQALPDTDARSLVSGVWMLTHYMRTYLHDTYVIYRDKGGPFIERDFSLLVYDSPALYIELFGRIDFALMNEATGEVLVGDHKTTSRMGSEFMNRIKPNHQYTGYVMGAQRCFGLSNENFMVNGIQSKARPLTARGGPPTFIRQITRRTEEDIEEFVEVLRAAVFSFLNYSGGGVWPLGPVDACANYGGCGYQDVCSSPSQMRQSLLESKFQKEVTCHR